MNEWTVVTVIVVLSGLVISFVKPLISLNSTLTRLADAVSVLEHELKESSEKNREAHAKLWEKESEQDARLHSHELRLTQSEKDAGRPERQHGI